MTELQRLLLLIVTFFITSVIGVVTGSNSLIAVPVMFQVGIDEKVAIATNMFALTFMAIGGTLPFLRNQRIDLKKARPLVVVTIIGSVLGALLVGRISEHAIRLVVTGGMIGVVLFTLLRRNNHAASAATGNLRPRPFLGMAATFCLAIYGGLFSGGYVTILTIVFVTLFGMSYAEAVGTTKLVNVFSSLVATLIFIWEGLVDYGLGFILGITMFAGAYIGATVAVKINERLLRQIFLSAVILLAVKMLYDLIHTF